MRLIDADALCEDLLKRWSVAETRKEELIRAVMADIVTPIIVSQPTIELSKRKTAQWVKTEIGWKCSNCTLCTNLKGKTEFSYCPNCGRRMEGESEMRNIKCSDCAEYRNEWCEKNVDSPYPDMLRDCHYWNKRKDMVEVVRCKDCKWFGKAGCAIGIVDESDRPKENDYCSFGERGESE